jgi:hypothetical protein
MELEQFPSPALRATPRHDAADEGRSRTVRLAHDVYSREALEILALQHFGHARARNPESWDPVVPQGDLVGFTLRDDHPSQLSGFRQTRSAERDDRI